MRGQIKVFILRALLRAGEPYTRTAVVTAVQASLGPQALVSDITSCLKELVALGLLVEVGDMVAGEVNFVLTIKGEGEAKKHE